MDCLHNLIVSQSLGEHRAVIRCPRSVFEVSIASTDIDNTNWDQRFVDCNKRRESGYLSSVPLPVQTSISESLILFAATISVTT